MVQAYYATGMFSNHSIARHGVAYGKDDFKSHSGIVFRPEEHGESHDVSCSREAAFIGAGKFVGE